MSRYLENRSKDQRTKPFPIGTGSYAQAARQGNSGAQVMSHMRPNGYPVTSVTLSQMRLATKPIKNRTERLLRPGPRWWTFSQMLSPYFSSLILCILYHLIIFFQPHSQQSWSTDTAQAALCVYHRPKCWCLQSKAPSWNLNGSYPVDHVDQVDQVDPLETPKVNQVVPTNNITQEVLDMSGNVVCREWNLMLPPSLQVEDMFQDWNSAGCSETDADRVLKPSLKLWFNFILMILKFPTRTGCQLQR